MIDTEAARGAVEEAIRFGNPFPHSSRFVGEPFTSGDLQLQPGDQVLLWLTAANRDLPGPHRRPLDRFDPWRDNTQQVGWGSGYHLCGVVHRARSLAEVAVTTLARRHPNLVSADRGSGSSTSTTGSSPPRRSPSAAADVDTPSLVEMSTPELENAVRPIGSARASATGRDCAIHVTPVGRLPDRPVGRTRS
jgi:cytochrome P450